MMLARILLVAKRRRLMQKLKSFDIKYHSERLGTAMAEANNDRDRKYHHEKIHESIRQSCEEHNIKHEDLSLVEEDLNQYINSLVQAAYEKESQNIKVREFVDNRIKIKRLTNLDPSETVPVEEP